MKILKGKQIIDIDDNGLKEIASNFKDIIVDIGTGDGKFVYNLAKQNSQSLFIGIDSSAEGMFDYSIKSSSKPGKGGLKNVLYVAANAEQLPIEIFGLADKIYVNLPWGSLRDGIIKGEGLILKNLKEIAKKGSYIELCIAYSELYEKKEVEIRQLPQLSYEYINTVLREKYKASNLDIFSIELLDNDKLKKVNTKWAKKLAFGRQRTIYYFKCRVF